MYVGRWRIFRCHYLPPSLLPSILESDPFLGVRHRWDPPTVVFTPNPSSHHPIIELFGLQANNAVRGSNIHI